MLGVTFICVGRMREAHFIAAFAEYEKRLGALCRFELKEIPETKLPERPAEAEIAAAPKAMSGTTFFRRTRTSFSQRRGTEFCAASCMACVRLVFCIFKRRLS